MRSVGKILRRTVAVAALLLATTGCSARLAWPTDDQATPGVQTVSNTVTDDAAIGGGVSPYALPFATGTSMDIAQGPHAFNYRSVPGYTFSHQDDVLASIDFGVNANTPAYPVASGRVLNAWPQCHVVVVDHGGGVWAEYVHLNVSVTTGTLVTGSTVLGTIMAPYTGTCGDYSIGQAHLHLAFINGSGSAGAFVPVAGRVMCGHTIDGSGNLLGLGTVRGSWFSVPDCSGTQQTVTPAPTAAPTATPTVAPTAQRTQAAVPTPARTPTATPPSATTCVTPSLIAPGDSVSFDSTSNISLLWNTGCSASYAELRGGPYGTLSFGGWQSASRVQIGTMWPGTYTWHVKGRSSTGLETDWSYSWTFTIRPDQSGPTGPTPVPTSGQVVSAPTPTPTVTPTPVPSTPAPTAGATPTPCPFNDGGNGVTFYTNANFTGQSWTWYVPAGKNDTYSELPGFLYQSLGSFWVANNAWHVVLYQSDNGTGNLGHYDASWANVDSYWHATKSVKIYINRTC
jgi:hypothetical protein